MTVGAVRVFQQGGALNTQVQEWTVTRLHTNQFQNKTQLKLVFQRQLEPAAKTKKSAVLLKWHRCHVDHVAVSGCWRKKKEDEQHLRRLNCMKKLLLKVWELNGPPGISRCIQTVSLKKKKKTFNKPKGKWNQRATEAKNSLVFFRYWRFLVICSLFHYLDSTKTVLS